MLDDLIEKRRRRGIDVKVSKFDDYDHVLRLRKHPDEYNVVLDRVLTIVSSA